MNPCVLIADDEEMERRAIRRILESVPGLELVEASNGVEVLEIVNARPITAVLLDIKMPGLDGIAVAEALRRDHSDVAVVFLTAYDQFDYARSALRLQVDEFLLKPASAEEILSALGKVLDKVASREGERQSSRDALVRLDHAIALVAQQLRHDLSGGLPDEGQVAKFLELQGLEGGPLAVLEARPAQPGPRLHHLVNLVEGLLAATDAAALAGVRGSTLRVLVLGDPSVPRDWYARLTRFREELKTQSGVALLLGAAVTAAKVHPDALVSASHRAASLAHAGNPILLVTVGPAGPGRLGAGLPPVVARVLELLEARMEEDLSLNAVAAEVGLSPSHLSRQLARATGNGFADCLAQVRIAEAKRHLVGPMAVKEIAHLVGFRDPAYFARVFRRLEGCSPADFRAGQEAKP